jgi:nucleoside-diphosphate-sugar epimerase
LVFNDGTGVRITLNQVLKRLKTISVEKIHTKYEPMRAGNIRNSQADISPAAKGLGYKPLVLFDEGLRRTWEWYKSAYGNK